MAEESVVKYIGHNVSKIRWKPEPSGAIGCSEVFATGSSDEQENMLCMWKFRSREGPEDERTVIEPELICKKYLSAGVTDLCFFDEQNLVASLESGGVVMFQYLNAAEQLKQLQVWESLHCFPSGDPAPCTTLTVCKGEAAMGLNIITGGEDGRITVLNLNDLRPLTVIENADNSTVTALSCSMQLEVLSTSSSGQLKIWDLRTNTERPTNTVEVAGTSISMDSLDRHPHQPHLVAIGRGDGSLCFMDLRQYKHTLRVARAHSAHVWEVKFDHSHPNNLFTCSQDGGLWHWDVNANRGGVSGPAPSSTRHHQSRAADDPPPSLLDASAAETDTVPLASPWLSGAVEHGNVVVQDYSQSCGLSANSLDIESRHLLCSTDNEAILVVPNLTLR